MLKINILLLIINQFYLIFYLISLIILGCLSGIEKKDCLCFEVKEPESISVERPISINLNKKENTCWDQEMILIKKS